MRIALTHNLKLSASEEEAEFDSPETIEAVTGALARAGHHVERMEVSGPASRLVARLEAYAPDIIFNSAEGRRGKMRRGFYPALFEELGIPVTGSDAYALCVTLDKTLTKRILAGYGVPSPRGRMFTRASLKDGGLDDLPFPVLVKPNFEGSSKGVAQANVVEDPIELGQALDRLLSRYPDGVVLERYIAGTDLRVARIDGLPPLPPVEIVVDPAYRRRFDLLDYALKHKDATFVSTRVPAHLPPAVLERVGELSDRVFSALGVRDVGSLDFRVGLDGQVYFLSATCLPSFEPAAPLFAATRFVGLDYDATILAILRAATKRAGLGALFDSTKPRRPNGNGSAGKRPVLRVGLAFNMKRIDSTDDDREAEFDSPKTIHAITRAIESYGHTVVPLEATVDFPRVLMASNVDLVFNIAEGISGRNREAQVPNLCELLGVPYTGSDAATLSICLDKALAKRMLAAGTERVLTPEFQVLFTGREKLRAFRYPVIVKPNAEGTSKGINGKSVVDGEARVREVAREIIERYGQPAIVEEYIRGREFTVGLLGERRPRVLPPMEIVFLQPSDRAVYGYAMKQDWEKHVRYECPPSLTKDELRAMEKVCRTTFTTLGCRDVARIDLRMTREGQIYVIEVNPLPGLTPNYSDLCLIANAAHVEYRLLIGEILSYGIKRWRERHPATGEPAQPRTADDEMRDAAVAVRGTTSTLATQDA
ncbi:ATP-grasp domain-containing protein [Pendulispora albinea]|uniref:D-alanine--D-alanine ligase n=1 Tax=Pendulispora albinea TaxID=2741071 RepID=A0ABZ2M0S6_9BACT